jgi:hypothetical protein
MNGSTYQTQLAGGLATRLPQNPQDAGRLQNWTLDRVSGGWSSRIGYEQYRTGQPNWEPFQTVGPVTSLHVAQQLAGGARQAVLFEADGKLSYVYESPAVPGLLTLAEGRHIPTPTEAGSWFTDTPYGVIVTNGVDRPVIVNPWPLGDAAEASPAITRCIRPFGFSGQPIAPEPLPVQGMPAKNAVDPFYTPTIQGTALTIWNLDNPEGVADGGRWGLGFPGNTGTDAESGDNQAQFAYAVSFITNTGSEGPASELGTVAWSPVVDSAGFRHTVGVQLPVGPEGTVARKLYRTRNYSDDFQFVGDTTLYFLDVIRNNTEDLFFDAVRSPGLGQPQAELATGPLPAPRARFSALFGGSLWLDGGIDDGLSLYYSQPGLIEQFGATNFIQLSSEGGAVTGLFAHYTTLLVFREQGIDVVTGDFVQGFQVTTISNSITCLSPHSIAAVPGLGVVFLATDGVYALTGGLQGGAIQDAVNLTVGQDEVIERMTPDCLPKAQGVFSAALREYHVYFPVNGNDRPNLGLVLHLDRLALVDSQRLSPWSTRRGFPVGALATRADGTVIFGHNTGAESGDPNTERGLFVLSGKRALGSSIQEQAMVFDDPPTSTYRSAWYSAGDPQLQKEVTYVTIWVMTTGDASITMRHYKDFSLTPVLERTYLAQPPDAAVLPTLDTTLLGAPATYQKERLVPLRYSVAHQSAAWFCFELETTADIILVGHEYMYNTKGSKVIMGRRA